MTYNVFGGTLSLTQSINLQSPQVSEEIFCGLYGLIWVDLENAAFCRLLNVANSCTLHELQPAVLCVKL